MNAEADNALYDQKQAGEEAKAEFDTLSQKSVRLRKVMHEARLQVSTFAQFEQRIRDLQKLRRPN